MGKCWGSTARGMGPVVLVLAASLGGCSSAYLHDKEANKLSQRAEEAFGRAQVTGVLASARSGQEQLAARELAVAGRLSSAERDRVLLGVLQADSVEGSWGALAAQMDQRLEELLGGGFVAGLRRAPLRRDGRGLDLIGAQGQVGALTRHAERADDAAASQSGELAALMASHATYLGRRTAALGVGPASAAGIGTSEEQLPLASELFAAASDLSAQLSGGSTGVGAQAGEEGSALALELRKGQLLLQTLNRLLDGLASRGPLEEDNPRYRSLSLGLGADLVVLRAISSLRMQIADEQEGLLAVAEEPPPLTSLLMEAEHLRLELRALAARTRQAVARTELLRARRDAGAHEARRLLGARELLRSLRARHGSAAFGQVLETLSDDLERERFVTMLLAFADAWDQGRTAGLLFERRAEALESESALIASESALRQWQNLVGVPLSQLLAVYRQGIFAEDLIGFVSSLGVLAGAATVE